MLYFQFHRKCCNPNIKHRPIKADILIRDLSAALICFASVIGFNNPLILSLKACHKSGYLIGLSHHCELNRHIQLKSR